VRFEFEVDWTIPRSQFKALMSRALKFADAHQLLWVSIERDIEKDLTTYQVFTSKNPVRCEPRPTITAAYKAAEEQIKAS